MKVVGKVVYSSEETQDDADVQRDGGALFTPALTRLLAQCCARLHRDLRAARPGNQRGRRGSKHPAGAAEEVPHRVLRHVAHRGEGGAGHRADVDRAGGLRRDRGGGRAAHRGPGDRQAAPPRRRRPRHAARARREPGRDDRRRAARDARRYRGRRAAGLRRRRRLVAARAARLDPCRLPLSRRRVRLDRPRRRLRLVHLPAGRDRRGDRLPAGTAPRRRPRRAVPCHRVGRGARRLGGRPAGAGGRGRPAGSRPARGTRQGAGQVGHPRYRPGHRGAAGDGDVRREPDHARLAPGAVRLELDLRAELRGHYRQPQPDDGRPRPRPGGRGVDGRLVRHRADRRRDRPCPRHGHERAGRAPAAVRPRPAGTRASGARRDDPRAAAQERRRRRHGHRRGTAPVLRADRRHRYPALDGRRGHPAHRDGHWRRAAVPGHSRQLPGTSPTTSWSPCAPAPTSPRSRRFSRPSSRPT